MAIPTYDQLIFPLLQVLEAHPDGIKSHDAYEAVAQRISLSDDDREVLLPSGKQPVYMNRVGWAQDRLKRAGLSVAISRGTWTLTDKGRAFMAEHSGGLDADALETLTNSAREIVVAKATEQRFQDTERAKVRLRAASDAAAMIHQTESWDAERLQILFGHLNTDLDTTGEKVVKNRLGLGLIGNNAKKLADSLDALQPWLAAVRQTAELDDQVVAALLADYWSRSLPNPYLFPSAVFSALAPERYTLFLKPLLKAAGAMLARPLERSKEPQAYLEACEALRDLCDARGWPLCLADAALHPFIGAPEPAAVGFPGYTSETVAFLREIGGRTEDAAWHREQKGRYKTVLRDPTRLLVASLAQKYIQPLDAEVAACSRPISILKKNDFGGESYYPYYWFAFFDPKAGSKTNSVQLFLALLGDRDLFRYGFGLGSYCAEYEGRLLGAFRRDPAVLVQFLSDLPDTVSLLLRKGQDEQLIPMREAIESLKRCGAA